MSIRTIYTFWNSTGTSCKKCTYKASGWASKVAGLMHKEVEGSIASRRPWSYVFRNWSWLNLKMYILPTIEFTTPYFKNSNKARFTVELYCIKLWQFYSNLSIWFVAYLHHVIQYLSAVNRGSHWKFSYKKAIAISHNKSFINSFIWSGLTKPWFLTSPTFFLCFFFIKENSQQPISSTLKLRQIHCISDAVEIQTTHSMVLCLRNFKVWQLTKKQIPGD